jgi:tripartite ATP-independent transporter DctM subunit
MFLGWATPSESAAIGAISALLLTAFYRKLNWELIKKSMMATVQNSGNILLIVAGSMIFSQVLAFSGSTRYLAEVAIGLTVSPILLIIIMQLFLLGLGMVMGGVPMVMITMPIFIPIVLALKFDPVWFGLLTLINMSLAEITPPVGMGLFVMKGVSQDTNMNDIYNATWPFVGINIAVMALIIIFPIIATWLPSLMN